jgi:hypothetical protein
MKITNTNALLCPVLAQSSPFYANHPLPDIPSGFALCWQWDLQEPALEAAGLGAQNLVVNLIGCAVFATLWSVDQSAAETRVEQRRQLRQAQIRQGDREVFVNEQGETMSRLKEVSSVNMLLQHVCKHHTEENWSAGWHAEVGAG